MKSSEELSPFEYPHHMFWLRIKRAIQDSLNFWKFRDATTQLRMGESFQDYSWIQDFEADFPQKIILKILN